MNRNVNMTGNFSSMNGRGLKPGDTALNSKKTNGNYGGDQYVKSNVGSNTNSNFNNRGGFGHNIINKQQENFNDNEINEAKESLKLLKMKMGNNFGGNRTSGSNGNYEAQKNYENSSINSNNGNYRKPFKPNLNDNFGNDRIQIETNKKIVTSDNRNMMHGVKKPNVNNNQNGNKLYSNNQKPVVHEENDDDRPAVAQGKNNFEEEVEDYDNGDRRQCPTCNRKFVVESYQKHVKNCKKVFASKRKQFDSKKKRVINSEHAMILKHQEIEEKKKGKMNPNTMINKKNKWKKQSEEFRAILRNNRTTTGFGNTPANKNNGNNTVGRRTGTNYNQGSMGSGTGKGYTNTPSVLTEDYKLCNMCTRKYNEQAYIKHLPTCERRTKEAMMKSKLKSGGGSTSNNTYGNKPNLNMRFKK